MNGGTVMKRVMFALALALFGLWGMAGLSAPARAEGVLQQ